MEVKSITANCNDSVRRNRTSVDKDRSHGIVGRLSRVVSNQPALRDQFGIPTNSIVSTNGTFETKAGCCRETHVSLFRSSLLARRRSVVEESREGSSQSAVSRARESNGSLVMKTERRQTARVTGG